MKFHLAYPVMGEGSLHFQIFVHRIQIRQKGGIFLRSYAGFGDRQTDHSQDRKHESCDRTA